MLCKFLLYNKVNQLCVCVCVCVYKLSVYMCIRFIYTYIPFLLSLPTHTLHPTPLGFHRALC